MIDDNFALMRSYHNNIGRYRNLLKINLSGLERRFIERRLAEEQSKLASTMASTFPLAWGLANSPQTSPAAAG